MDIHPKIRVNTYFIQKAQDIENMWINFFYVFFLVRICQWVNIF